MAVVAAGIVDKAGRKPLLLFSAVVMSGSLAALGLFFKLQETDSLETESKILAFILMYLPLVSLVLYMIAFSIG